MNFVKILRDALFATFLLAMLIIMSWATPFSFIGEVVFTPFGLFLLFLVALQEVIFIRL